MRFVSRGTLLLTAVLFLSVIVAGCSLPGSQGSSVSPAEFYKGKVVTIIVPYAPGGGFDQYPRLAAPFLEKNIPGSSVVVENVPAAGGIVGVNTIYAAKPDGLTIGIGNIGGLILASINGQEGVAYDLAKMTWLGRIFSDARAVYVASNSGISTPDDLKKLGRPVKLATNVGSEDYFMSIALFKALDVPLKLVTGYESSQERDLAVLRGEVDGTINSMSTALISIQGGSFKPLIFISDKAVAGYEKVPLAKDLSKNADTQKLLDATFRVIELERSFIAPPGIPADRVAFLRGVFDKTFADPELIAVLTKAKRPVVWMDGKTCEQKIVTIMADAQQLKGAFKDYTP
jgi:tripartite-type tricarboxylate transporter receptor subunit TctC